MRSRAAFRARSGTARPPARRFSSTERCSKTWRPSGTCTTPERTTCLDCGRPLRADYTNRRTLATLAGVTRLSRGEVSGGRHSSSTFSLVFVALSIAAVFFVVISMNRHVWPALAVATLFAWRVVPAFFQACRTPTPAAIRAAVKRGVLSLVLLDAALATAFAGIGYGLVLLAAALGSLWLGRTFSVT